MTEIVGSVYAAIALLVAVYVAFIFVVIVSDRRSSSVAIVAAISITTGVLWLPLAIWFFLELLYDKASR